MKKRIIFLVCIICALMLLTACSATDKTPVDNSQAYRKITPQDGKQLLESDTIFTLVDVRRADEYEEAHIPSSLNIPNESIENTQPEELPDLNQTVVVYCRTGVRSKQAAEKLIEIGYTDVRDMGGISDWPYDTVTGQEPGEYISKKSGGIMSGFSSKDLEGNNVDKNIFAQYDLTMINVWATYCGPCLAEMPEIGELADEYESKGVRIVGIVMDVLNSDGTLSEDQLDTARSIVKRTGANYTHIIPSDNLYGLLSQITAVPTTFFVDSNGAQVGKAYLGSKSKTEWNDIIVQMLEESQK